ncbi:MAG: hypothetical protein HY887_03655, partial [Deltaproteobacteria bacterium]|nr:hypothetical protein [Deltaproteobacteria bacterium]
MTARLDANLTLVQAIPIIAATPSYIDTGLVRGTQRLAAFTITNTGLETLKNARLEGPSTTWMALTIDKNIGDIKPGSSISVGILLKPSDTITQNIYDDRIVIYSDNHIPYTFNIQATVTSSAVGNVMFDVLNEFLEDVPNASITIQHQLITELIYNLKTTADGTVSTFDIPEGRYTYNITAAGHLPYSGSFTIQPGITTAVPIALEVNMITIEWSVVPTTIQDKYEIKVTQTFATNVPVPVLIAEPAGVTLPDMQQGQIYNGEFTLTNYGLIAIEDVSIQFPAFIEDYDIEVFTSAIPRRIGAMEKVTVPYRITRRQQTAMSYELSPVGNRYACNTGNTERERLARYSELFNDLVSYGGACYTFGGISIKGRYLICPNTAAGRWVDKAINFVISIFKDCGGSGSGGSGGGGSGGGGGYIGGGGSGSQSGSGGSLPAGGGLLTWLTGTGCPDSGSPPPPPPTEPPPTEPPPTEPPPTEPPPTEPPPPPSCTGANCPCSAGDTLAPCLECVSGTTQTIQGCETCTGSGAISGEPCKECQNGVKVQTQNCTTCTSASQCYTSDPCLNAGCFNGTCAYLPKNCDDGLYCTADACTETGCANTPIPGCVEPTPPPPPPPPPNGDTGGTGTGGTGSGTGDTGGGGG